MNSINTIVDADVSVIVKVSFFFLPITINLLLKKRLQLLFTRTQEYYHIDVSRRSYQSMTYNRTVQCGFCFSLLWCRSVI